MNDVLGYKFRVVRGYGGTPQINLAIERGEVQGMGGLGWASVKAQTPHWISGKLIKVLAQYGFQRHAELPEAPIDPRVILVDKQNRFVKYLDKERPAHIESLCAA